jgi:hypothetical protein
MSTVDDRRKSTLSQKAPVGEAKKTPTKFVSKLKKSYTNAMDGGNTSLNNLSFSPVKSSEPPQRKTVQFEKQEPIEETKSKNSSISHVTRNKKKTNKNKNRDKEKDSENLMPQISEINILNKENIMLKNSIKDFLKFNNNTVTLIDEETDEVRFSKVDEHVSGKLTRFASLIKTSIDIVEDMERGEGKKRNSCGFRRTTTLCFIRSAEIPSTTPEKKPKFVRGRTMGVQEMSRKTSSPEVTAKLADLSMDNKNTLKLEPDSPPQIKHTYKNFANSTLQNMFLSHSNILKSSEDDIDVKSMLDSKENNNSESLRLNPRDSKILRKSLLLVDSSQMIDPKRDLIKRRNVYDSLSDEEMELYGASEYVIHPSSKFKIYLDNLVYISFVYSVMTLPIFLAFIKEKCNSQFTFYTLTFFDCLIDILYIADLILSFFTGYYDFEENVIYKPKKIADNYIFSYFIFDLASAIPFCSLVNLKILEDLTLRWLKIFRLTKFIKVMMKKSNHSTKHTMLSSFLKYLGLKDTWNTVNGIKIFNIRISPKTMQLLRYILYYLVICHVFTGIWMYVSLLSPGINWTNSEKIDFTCDNVGSFYLASLYFTMVTFFTVGYGDIFPQSIVEKCYSVVILLLALIIYSFTVSFLSNFALYQTTREKELERNIDYLQEVSFNYGIPYEMYKSIIDYLRFPYQTNKTDNNIFLFELPTTLRNELICEMYKDIIKTFKFFKNNSFSQDSIVKVIMAMRPVIAYKGEEIIKEGGFVEEIVFVRTGRLILSVTYKNVLIKLLEINKREHFGDYFMINNKRSPVSVTVRSSVCDMFLLRKTDLESIPYFLEVYSDVFKKSTQNMKRMYFIVKKNKKALNKRLKMNQKNVKINNYVGKETEADLNKLMKNDEKELIKKVNENQNNNLLEVVPKQTPGLKQKLSNIKTIKECEENEELSLGVENNFFNKLESDLSSKHSRIFKKNTLKEDSKKNFEVKSQKVWSKLENEMKSEKGGIFKEMNLQEKKLLKNLEGNIDKSSKKDVSTIKINTDNNLNTATFKQSESQTKPEELNNDKMNINLNYYNNLSITNKGNLFINFNMNQENSKQGKLNVPESTNNFGQVINFKAQDFPNIIINNNEGGKVTTTMSDASSFGSNFITTRKKRPSYDKKDGTSTLNQNSEKKMSNNYFKYNKESRNKVGSLSVANSNFFQPRKKNKI